MRIPPPPPVVAALVLIGAGAAAYAGYWLAGGYPLATVPPTLVAAVVVWSAWKGRRAGRTAVLMLAGLVGLVATAQVLLGLAAVGPMLALGWCMALVLLVTVPDTSRDWFTGGRLFI